jgi:arsenate reductase
MKVSELARRAGVAPSAVRFYEQSGVLPYAPRRANGYREYGASELARLRLVVALRRLGLAPVDAGRLAALCMERGEVDLDLAPLIATQRAAVERQRSDLDRLDAELTDLELTIQAAGRARRSSEGNAMSVEPIRVLFVCTGNSARSQIAEALLRDFGGADFEVFSAGTEPKGVNPFAVRVLAEIEIDWSGARSKSVTEFLGRPFDYVITVCDRARQTCPVFPGNHNTLHWGLDDPAEVEGTDERKLEAFRHTRIEVATRLRPFIELARRARAESPTPD